MTGMKTLRTTLKTLFAAGLGFAVLMGCEKKQETPSGSPAPTPQASESAADATKSKAADARGAVKDMASDAAKSAKEQASTAASELKKGAENAADAVAANPAAADATAKVQQVLDYIKDHKLDMAESTLKQVEANKSTLPAAVAAQVDNARKMLDAAKAATAASKPAAG